MDDLEALLSQMRIVGVNHLLVVAAFCRRIGLIQTVDRLVPTGMDLGVGKVVQGLVLDTLSGRTPLYRLPEFFEQQDSGLLLGAEVPASAFNDTTVGRAMDAIYDAGAGNVFCGVAYQAARLFPQDLRTLRWDSTSVNVWGDYAGAGPNSDALAIVQGYSKDHRPDLKQFLLDVLCAGRNVPLLGGCHDGNASDKALNNALLTRISKDLARFGLGPGDWVYVADCALVTEENLKEVGENLFLTRLPFSYGEAGRVVAEAVAAARWVQVGTLTETPDSARRPPAQYRLAEAQVQLYGRSYRAIVVHSSAHDRRRLKAIDRQIAQEAQTLATVCRRQSRREYFCRADAEAEAQRLQSQQGGQFHRLDTAIVQRLRHPPGRPPRDRPRPVASVHYLVQATPEPDALRIARQREEAGCFVLLTNVPDEGPGSRTATDLLHAYKDQHAIERNFSFLKDPLIVNDLFLKKPERIEALGAILLISLLVWNLIEQCLRQHVEHTGAPLPGWDRRETRRPTTFMMTTKFAGLQVVRLGQRYRLAQPLRDVQAAYLRALGLSLDDLLSLPTGPP